MLAARQSPNFRHSPPSPRSKIRRTAIGGLGWDGRSCWLLRCWDWRCSRHCGVRAENPPSGPFGPNKRNGNRRQTRYIWRRYFFNGTSLCHHSSSRPLRRRYPTAISSRPSGTKLSHWHRRLAGGTSSARLTAGAVAIETEHFPRKGEVFRGFRSEGGLVITAP